MPLLPFNLLFVAVDEMMGTSSGVGYSMEGRRDYTRRFLVQKRVRGLSPKAVCNAPFIPVGGSFYVTPFEYDLLAIVTEKSSEPQVKDDWQNDVVTVKYSTVFRNRTKQSPENQNNPEMERPDVDWDFETIKISPQRDLGGVAFLNSAHMPFTPAPSFDVGVPVLVITRNELSFNVQKASNYSYALNDNTFLGYPALTVQCLPPKAKQTWRGSYRFWRVTYRLRFAPLIPNPNFDEGLPPNPDTNPPYIYYPWQPKLLDQGMYHLDTQPTSATFNKPVPIFRFGAQLHHPILLNGAGQEAPEIPPVPRYLDFTIYPSADFTKLVVEGLKN